MSSFINNNEEEDKNESESNFLIDNNRNNNNEEKEPLGLLSFGIDVMIIILKFLTLKDLGRIDTAYCNKNKRDQLLSILRNEIKLSIVYDNINFDDSFKYIDSVMIWFGNRKINVLNLSISNYNLTDYGLLGLLLVSWFIFTLSKFFLLICIAPNNIFDH